jgi:tetratricopeptide (TPR) repeat protein
MDAMPETTDRPWTSLESRIQRALERCLEWSQQGRHRRVLSEVERLLKIARGDRHLEAQLLIWKAQALLSMGQPDRALTAASDSWELSSSPHACHLMSTSLNAVGETDQAEELLAMGVGLFPEAIHLPVQLAMMLADQGRLPESLEVLDRVSPTTQLPDDMQVFLVGLRANLLATIGRWSEAEAVLEEGLGRHPGSELLLETHHSISLEWNRKMAEESLAESWREAMEPLDGVAAEVDEAVVHGAAMLELDELLGLAARRLWRSFHACEAVRLQSPEAWGAALVTAVLELDGFRPSAAAVARATGSNPSTLRSALRRLRRYLDDLDPGFARRAFGAVSNPRLDDQIPDPLALTRGTVVPFPGSQS